MDELLYEVRDGIGRITFNRPARRNALTFPMYERLAEICTEVSDGFGREGNVRALILTGTGEKAFAAGTDIGQFRAFTRPEDGIEYEERIDRVLEALERCPVPTIAAIAGACTGGGAGIAASCDLRIAARNARFGFPIARSLGNCLSMANYARLSDLMGTARVTEMIFTARLIEADEARTIGLVSELLDDSNALAARADELAKLVAGHAPLTLRATKEALRRLRARGMAEADGHDLIVSCYMSQDFHEGMEAFLAKRPPVWRGR
jgi:enoyl-CoA hydratase